MKLTKRQFEVLLDIADDLKSIAHIESMLNADGMAISKEAIVNTLGELIDGGLAEAYEYSRREDPESPAKGYTRVELRDKRPDADALWFYITHAGVKKIRRMRGEES